MILLVSTPLPAWAAATGNSWNDVHPRRVGDTGFIFKPSAEQRASETVPNLAANSAASLMVVRSTVQTADFPSRVPLPADTAFGSVIRNSERISSFFF